MFTKTTIEIEAPVVILLATYNGEKYIADQLNSILHQTYINWQMYIRDDGSTDDTLKIISTYTTSDSRFTVLKDGLGNLGSVQNFNALLQHSKHNEYIMFCDQDDVWLPSKIEDTLAEMLKLEKLYGKETALLVHTNFRYVDEELSVIKSKRNFTATKITDPSFASVLCQNSVHGCAMMINNKLAIVTGNIPQVAENHDYWIALVCSAFGKIYFLNKRTVLYRQHGKNISTQYNFNSFSNRFKRIFINKKNFDDITSKLKMAIAFKNIFNNQLSENNKHTVNEFIELSGKKSLPLFLKNFKNGVRRQTVSQTLLFYLTILFSKKEQFTKSGLVLKM